MGLFPSNFENIFLTVILWSSIVFFALSIFIMFGIILVKIYKNIRSKKNAKRKKIISNMIYIFLDTPDLPKSAIAGKIKKSDIPLLLEVCLNILRPTQGMYQKRLLDILEFCEIQPYIEKVLKKGTRGKKIQALTILSRFPKIVAIPYLLKFASYRDRYIQLSALYGLSTLKANEHIREIIEISSNLTQASPLLIADVLVKFGDPAVPYLIELAKNENASSEMRISSIKALGKLRALSALETLMTLTHAHDFNIRAQSLSALRQLGNISAAEIILERLRDRETVVRLQAAKAAGALGLQAAIPDLVHLLADDFWWTRYSAAYALYALGGRGLTALQAAILQGGKAADIAQQYIDEKESFHG